MLSETLYFILKAPNMNTLKFLKNKKISFQSDTSNSYNKYKNRKAKNTVNTQYINIIITELFMKFYNVCLKTKNTLKQFINSAITRNTTLIKYYTEFQETLLNCINNSNNKFSAIASLSFTLTAKVVLKFTPPFYTVYFR